MIRLDLSTAFAGIKTKSGQICIPVIHMDNRTALKAQLREACCNASQPPYQGIFMWEDMEGCLVITSDDHELTHLIFIAQKSHQINEPQGAAEYRLSNSLRLPAYDIIHAPLCIAC